MVKRLKKKYEIKFCVVCGRRIPELSRRKLTCSDYCKTRKKCGYAPYIDFTEPQYDDLATVQKKAREKGLSYGQYVALYENVVKPSAEPPQKSGEWIEKDGQLQCSECGYAPRLVGKEKKPMVTQECPGCKSEMKIGE